MMRYLCRAFPKQAGDYYPSDKWNEIDMLLDYMGSGILDLLPKAVYPTLGFPAFPGDVAAMESTKSFTEEAAKAASSAMLKQLEVGALRAILDIIRSFMHCFPISSSYSSIYSYTSLYRISMLEYSYLRPSSY